jgi:hypothetical protein
MIVPRDSPKTPIFASRKGGLAQLARAFAWHAKGHRFDSGNLHEIQPAIMRAFFMPYS